MLILTNDGNLTNLLNSPSSMVDKTYIAKINGILTNLELKALKLGILIDNRKTSKAKVKVKSVNRKEKTSIVELTIHEGRNHQVKKMFEKLGYEVIKLKREKYANLTLLGVKTGDYRKLTTKEVKILYNIGKNS